ncbi:MAG: hypothetical protein JJ971_04725 [Balneolaceae bacterium]|nr:hypothetical protein [Balneolaceae bacterium]MBO6545680.1 hypothetical protein [Balneolaceae bacterium]MBO6647076.1 hypothetical protein [Balneolaceae bacterium]
MKKPKLLYFLFLPTVFIACSNQVGTDIFDISTVFQQYHRGSAVELYTNVEDTLYDHPYSIVSIERIKGANIDSLDFYFQYSGGEGGCPEHYFYLQWNPNDSVTDFDTLHVGVAHFINQPDNCEALVRSNHKFDLNRLFQGDVANHVEKPLVIENLYTNELYKVD